MSGWQTGLVRAQQEFCEECEGQRRTVVRPQELADNAALPERLQRAAGDRIYSGLQQGFRVGTATSVACRSEMFMQPCCASHACSREHAVNTALACVF